MLSEAIKDFRAVVKVAPQDADARSKLSECEKELRRIEFEKAITFEEVVKSALEMIGNIDEISVGAAYFFPLLLTFRYEGPHLPETGITLEFVQALLAAYKAQKTLHKKYAYKIMSAAKTLFESQPPIVDVTIPEGARLTVCGDIHGQFYDLLHIFDLNGLPSPTNMYLWNGDFVDRGSFSVECILTLLAFKILYPDAIYLTRGNHETDSMNKVCFFRVLKNS